MYKKSEVISDKKGIKVTKLRNGYSVDKHYEGFPLGLFETENEAEIFANNLRLTQ